MAEEIKTVTLENGLVLRFFDQTNRYFGDFHRICILVELSLPEQYELPVGLAKDNASLKRTLEKMGVSTAAVAEMKNKMIDTFLETSRSYLEKESFPQQLAARLLRESGRPVFQRNQ